LEETRHYRTKNKKNDYDTLPLPFLTYETLNKLLQSKNSIPYSIRTGDKTIGFLLVFGTPPVAEALLIGTDKDYYNKGTSPFVYDFAFKDLKEKNYTIVNLGGIPEGKDGEMLARFKKSLGAQEVTVHGATTNFLTYPYKLLNPLLNIGRKLPKNNPAVTFLKKFL
jgi:lipid II:glycine glycyltransferase (peptidoglycan interpeptide bridge formation enzyme)